MARCGSAHNCNCTGHRASPLAFLEPRMDIPPPSRRSPRRSPRRFSKRPVLSQELRDEITTAPSHFAEPRGATASCPESASKLDARALIQADEDRGVKDMPEENKPFTFFETDQKGQRGNCKGMETENLRKQNGHSVPRFLFVLHRRRDGYAFELTC